LLSDIAMPMQRMRFIENQQNKKELIMPLVLFVSLVKGTSRLIVVMILLLQALSPNYIIAVIVVMVLLMFHMCMCVRVRMCARVCVRACWCKHEHALAEYMNLYNLGTYLHAKDWRVMLDHDLCSFIRFCLIMMFAKAKGK